MLVSVITLSVDGAVASAPLFGPDDPTTVTFPDGDPGSRPFERDREKAGTHAAIARMMNRDRASARHSDSSASANGQSWPPIVAALLGLSLVVSSFLWPHDAVQRLNTVACGALVLIIAFVSARFPVARYVNVAVGVWLLLVSTYALQTSVLKTEWNELFVGIVLIAVSIIPSRPILPWHQHHRHAAA